MIHTRSAEISECLKYRYRLDRVWGDPAGPRMTFCMLNPSTASAVATDPTIERVKSRAFGSGAHGLTVVNLFALRTKDPDHLYIPGVDPIGPKNDDVIREVAANSEWFICGWGQHGSHMNRATAVLKILAELDVEPWALKINRDGSPAHPLYLGYNLKPFPWATRHSGDPFEKGLCLACGRKGVDRAHIKSKGAGGGMDNSNIMLLCREHHTEQHKCGLGEFAKRYPDVMTGLDRKGWYVEDLFGVAKVRRKAQSAGAK